MVMMALPLALVAGVIVTVRLLALPPKTMLFVGTSAALDEALPNGRLAAAVRPFPMAKLNGPATVSSLTIWLARPVMVGGVFTMFTVRRKLSLVVFVPSLTLTVMVAGPVCPAAGVMVTVRLVPLPPKTMLFVGTSTGFEEAR